MSDFVLLFRTTAADRDLALGTPEQAQKSLGRWMEWIRGLEKDGHLKDRGQPLDFTGRVVRGPSRSVTDGPFAESKDVVAGFIVIAAKDIDEAVELSKGCPMLDGASTVEVRPVPAFPM